MELCDFDTAESLGENAAALIAKEISRKKSFVLCAATGESPTMTYQFLVEKKYQFAKTILSVVKLDEWGGIAPDHPATCESYLQQYLVRPLGIDSNNFISFQGDTADPEMECKRVQELLTRTGKIDLCVLGLGMNGHIAFNEPAVFLQPHCHVAKLTQASMQHPMALAMQSHGNYGLTLGMADILRSETIVFLVSGSKKTEIFGKFMTQEITTQLPASFLWLHPDVYCYYTKESLNTQISY
jgi:galactosamine-6-phosphate isomerase